MLTVTYAECHIEAPCAERCYAECQFTECRVRKKHVAVFKTIYFLCSLQIGPVS
jgi:hypothetical protein